MEEDTIETGERVPGDIVSTMIQEVLKLQSKALEVIHGLSEDEYRELNRIKIKDIILNRVLVRENLESLADELSYDIYSVTTGGDHG